MNIELYSSDVYRPIKNKLAICIFTFKGDNRCVSQCIKALEKHRANLVFDIFLIDDGLCPLDDIPENVFYSKSHYFRNGNLNGAECAQGQMMEMLRCARKASAEYVMKLDSDMIVNSFDNFLAPLWENPDSVVGFKLNPRMNYVAGVCYVFPVKGLYNGIRDFAVWYKKESETEEFAAHCPEDWAVSRCITAVNDYTMIQFNQVENSENWLLSPFDFDILEDVENIKIHPLIWHRYRIYDFVNFGNRYQLKCENPREVAAECMKQYMDFEEACQTH